MSIVSVTTGVIRIKPIIISTFCPRKLQPAFSCGWSYCCWLFWNYRLIIVRFRRFITPGATAG
jgi:hypothetical protein